MVGGSKAAVAKLMKEVFQGSQLKGTYHHVMRKVKFVDGDIGRFVASLKVEEEHTNRVGTLHGGMTASLVDEISTYALITDKPESLARLGASVHLGVEYLTAVREGTEIVIDAKLKKRGNLLAFLDVNITNKETGQLVAKGTHTKYIGGKVVLPDIK